MVQRVARQGVRDQVVLGVGEHGQVRVEAISHIDEMYDKLFRIELSSWYEDEALWPQDRSLKTFWEWFDVEVHSTLLDTVDADIMNSPVDVDED